MTFVRAKLALEDMRRGEILEIILNAGEPATNVPASIAEQGDAVLSLEEEPGSGGRVFRLRVRRG
ncbi:MAG: sulfurtransferase TusA family protein [Alphaproteobacteria bacterium]